MPSELEDMFLLSQNKKLLEMHKGKMAERKYINTITNTRYRLCKSANEDIIHIIASCRISVRYYLPLRDVIAIENDARLNLNGVTRKGSTNRLYTVKRYHNLKPLRSLKSTWNGDRKIKNIKEEEPVCLLNSKKQLGAPAQT